MEHWLSIVGVCWGEKILEAMEGAYSENKDAQLQLPPWLLHLPRSQGDSDTFLSP